ncbi:MAG TPA: LacI family DNA-binding transcriptional regulator [Yinghuangia sp.]|nr:LacI family DNA-binding transcriptional regulator [Yinghuangia sp.]
MSAVLPPPRPTSADVARRAGVSRATVSHVLNGTDHPISEPTRRRVLAAARELQYAPNASARALRAGRSNTVLLPMPVSLGLPGQDTFIEHLDRELDKLGLALLIHGDRGASGVKGARSWAELRPAAVYLDAARGTRPAVELLHRAGVQAVLLSSVQAVPYAPTIPLDQAAVARVAAQYLVDRGHRRLACLVPGGGRAALAERRWAAVAEVARAAGASAERVDCELTEDGVASAVAHWHDPARRPEAVYAFNDEFALALIEALRRIRVGVPEDVAVIGSGNQPLGAILRPALTTVRFDVPALARVVATSIRRLLDGHALDAAAVKAVAAQLIVRESA